jgi:hypothetical protein
MHIVTLISAVCPVLLIGFTAGTAAPAFTVSPGSPTAEQRVTLHPNLKCRRKRCKAKKPPATAPTARFTFSPAAPVVGQTVTFDGTSSSCTASRCTYRWRELSSGRALGTRSKLRFAFRSAGTKRVQLMVTNKKGSHGRVEHDVTIRAASPPSPPSPPAGAPAHTVIVVMENHDRSQVFGNPAAPYENSLATQGIDYTDDTGGSHPSLPNYLDLYAGSTLGQDGNDACIQSGAANLGQEAVAAGHSFKVFAEDLGTQNPRTDDGGYACRHNPAAQFTDAASTGASTDLGNFPSNGARLPTLSYVIPNLCYDTHDCSVATGDAWLQSHMDAYARWARAHNSALILTWDENAGSDLTTPIGLVVLGMGIVPSVQTAHVTHESVLRTVEAWYGLAPLGRTSGVTGLPGLGSRWWRLQRPGRASR